MRAVGYSGAYYDTCIDTCQSLVKSLFLTWLNHCTSDNNTFSQILPDHFQILGLFQVFQLGGNPALPVPKMICVECLKDE